jgi:hypothetical protein
MPAYSTAVTALSTITSKNIKAANTSRRFDDKIAAKDRHK